ncbi:MAG: S9 family peptidase [Proteobacteria bacterium]|nr:S9 family peptidase [Pseudomonadota bacterium]MCP4920817.1 S9 family peptidase [Pseudomonadota bacterium]
MIQFAPLLLALGCPKPQPADQVLALSAPTSIYPETRTEDVVDDFHGTQVADPYRWLEDVDDTEVHDWIAAQNRLTQGYLGQIEEREAIRARMTELWDYERYSTPSKKGDHYFWSYNNGLQNQSVMYVADGPKDEGRVLLDPNTLSEDGTVALSGTWLSKDGTKMAYGVSDAGSDWKTIRVMDVETGEQLSDELSWVKFSGASWDHTGDGFYYSRYDEPADPDDFEAINYFQKVYYHQLGAEQSADTLVYERPDQKEWGFGASVTHDGRYLLVYNRVGTDNNNRVYYKDLKKNGAVTDLFVDFDAGYSVIGNDKTVFYVETDKDAPNSKLMKVDIRKPSVQTDLIPESEDALKGCNLLNEQFVCRYLHNAQTQVKIFELDGTHVRDVELPGIGSAGGWGGEREDSETFYSFTSFTTPGTVYRYDMKTGESELFRAPAVSMDPEAFEVKQTWYESKDGTQVPMFVVHKAGLELDGTNPTYLYGYGGFNISLTPYYSTTNRVWLEMGGVIAIANLRGGGEFGNAWHDAGKLENKQNVFDDFHAAAEYLTAEGYTSQPHLGIAGGSNGGLLVGAAITQRPELYGAALPNVGVLDMLRFNKFTIGWAWESDYGSPEDPEMFPTLYAYSPYHNVKEGTAYPPTMVTTGDHDDRVVPGHSFKFAAALQAAQTGPNPVLIRINTRAGHGAGKPTAMIIDEHTDRWAFLARNLDMTVPDGFGATAEPTEPAEAPADTPAE